MSDAERDMMAANYTLYDGIATGDRVRVTTDTEVIEGTFAALFVNLHTGLGLMVDTPSARVSWSGALVRKLERLPDEDDGPDAPRGLSVKNYFVQSDVAQSRAAAMGDYHVVEVIDPMAAAIVEASEDPVLLGPGDIEYHVLREGHVVYVAYSPTEAFQAIDEARGDIP